MPYTIEKMPDEPVISLKIAGNISAEESAEEHKRLTAMLNEQTQAVNLIIDIREYSADFDGILRAIDRMVKDRTYNHPNIRKRICITTSKSMNAILPRLNTPQFGNLEVT